MDDNNRQGRTNYDWVNGMRVGIITGGAIGLVVGLLIGNIPAVTLLIGAATGGVAGAKLAQRW